jgi:hypothetical protein
VSRDFRYLVFFHQTIPPWGPDPGAKAVSHLATRACWPQYPRSDPDTPFWQFACRNPALHGPTCGEARGTMQVVDGMWEANQDVRVGMVGIAISPRGTVGTMR